MSQMMAPVAEEVAAAMAGFGRAAAAKAGFGFCASSEEEGFGRATKEEIEVDAATMAGFEEAAVSSTRASTGLEVAAVMAGLVGAAAAVAVTTSTFPASM